MIPPDFIHDLLARVDIVDIVGRQVQLKKAGLDFSGLCPFHAEKTPSFTVTPSKQFYHCFGCGANGNAIGFLVEQSGMSFVEAVKELAQEVGMAIPDDERSPAERERALLQQQRRSTLNEVLAKAADHYRRQLRQAPHAIDYLKQRGLSGEVAARFGLGYAPAGWHSLASAFPNYDDPLLEESGLVIAQDAGDTASRKRYDRFRERIMFPIRSVQGEVIGFGGRVLDKSEPKYLNSPETPVFSKGRELYGLHEARSALRQRGHALVVEGYMDVVALAQAGLENAVATLGTACTAEHVQKLFRFTDSVVFSFDGDAAGRRAAGRALEACLPHAGDTRNVRFLFLPPEHDPDSYVRAHGAAAFEACIASAVPLSRQLVARATEDCDLETAEGRARLVAQARPLLAQLPAGVLRGQIADAVAAAAHVAPAELRAATVPRPGHARPAETVHNAGPRLPLTGGLPAGPRRRPLAPMASSLDRAVGLLIQRTDLWERLGHEAQGLLAEQSPPHGDFFSWLDRLVHEHGALAPSALLDELGAAGATPDLHALATRVRQFHDMPAGNATQGELEIIVDRLRLQAAQLELEQLAGINTPSEAARTRQRELLQRQSELKARLARPVGASS